MIEKVIVSHVEDWVVLSGPEGGKIAKIKPEDAIALAHELLDHSERALRATDQLHEYK